MNRIPVHGSIQAASKPGMAMSVRLGLLAGLAISTSLAQAQTFTITFDSGDPIGGLPAGTVLSNQYAASLGVTFSPNPFTGPSGPGSNWATNTDVTVVESGGADVGGLGTPALVSGRMLRSFNGWLGEDGDASINVAFVSPMRSCSIVYAGISIVEDSRLLAFNAVNTPIASATATAQGQQVLAVVAPAIKRLVILPGSFEDWVGIDSISCTIDADVIFANGFEP